MQQLQVKCRFFLVFILLSASLTISCNRSVVNQSDEAVSWPQLVRFDEIAYRADGFARAGDLASVREFRDDILKAGRALGPSTIPSNASDPQQVETILADLASIIDGISSEELDDDSLVTLVLGLHTVIERLMNAAGMPHHHANEGPNDGFLHPLFDGQGTQVGTIEIKLHDDAGDIEVWVTRGGHGGEAWRLSIDTILSLTFPALGKNVDLAVRDRERNEDESGNSTIQDGATDYFIFPGETGADAAWLMGEDFVAKAELRFEEFTTGFFVLRPHVHHDHGE